MHKNEQKRKRQKKTMMQRTYKNGDAYFQQRRRISSGAKTQTKENENKDANS